MTTEPLLDFVRTQLRLGINREAITVMLVGQGWSIMDVNEAFEAVDASPASLAAPTPLVQSGPAAFQPMPLSQDQGGVSNSSPRKRKSHAMAIAITVLIIVCLGAGAVFAYYTFFPTLISSPIAPIQNSPDLSSQTAPMFPVAATSSQTTDVASGSLASSSALTLGQGGFDSGSIILHTGVTIGITGEPITIGYVIGNDTLTITQTADLCAPREVALKSGAESSYSCGKSLYYLDLISSTSTDSIDFRIGTTTESTPVKTAVAPSSPDQTDCGTYTVNDLAGAENAVGTSACFDQQFKLCQPAQLSVTIKGAETTKYEIVGESQNECKVVETVSGPSLPNATVISCLFDNTKDFSVAGSDTSKCSY